MDNTSLLRVALLQSSIRLASLCASAIAVGTDIVDGVVGMSPPPGAEGGKWGVESLLWGLHQIDTKALRETVVSHDVVSHDMRRVPEKIPRPPSKTEKGVPGK